MNNPFPDFIEKLKELTLPTQVGTTNKHPVAERAELAEVVKIAEQIALAHGQLIDEAENAKGQGKLLATMNRNLQDDLNKTSEALTRAKELAERFQGELENAKAKGKVTSGQLDTAEGLVTSLTKQCAELRRELAAAQARDEAGQRQIELSMKTCGELRENLERSRNAQDELQVELNKAVMELLPQREQQIRSLRDALNHAQTEAQKDHHQIQRLATGLTAAENELADLRWLTRLARIASNSSANFAPSRDQGIVSRQGAKDAEKGGAA